MDTKTNKNFYIIGANSAGVSLLHDIKKKFPNSMVVFLDEDTTKAGTTIEQNSYNGSLRASTSCLKP